MCFHILTDLISEKLKWETQNFEIHSAGVKYSGSYLFTISTPSALIAMNASHASAGGAFPLYLFLFYE